MEVGPPFRRPLGPVPHVHAVSWGSPSSRKSPEAPDVLWVPPVLQGGASGSTSEVPPRSRLEVTHVQRADGKPAGPAPNAPDLRDGSFHAHLGPRQELVASTQAGEALTQREAIRGMRGMWLRSIRLVDKKQPRATSVVWEVFGSSAR